MISIIVCGKRFSFSEMVKNWIAGAKVVGNRFAEKGDVVFDDF